jgi:hypothetical protein
VTIRQMRVGDASITIRFVRQRDGSTHFDVIEKEGTLFVVEAPPPQDINPDRQSYAEATKMWLLEHAPGRLTTALRLALGEDVPIGGA